MSDNSFQLTKLNVLPSGLFQTTLVGATTGEVNSPPSPDPADAGKVVVLNADGSINASLLTNASGGGGGGGGSVTSVNGQTGVVVLTATDVGADVAGSAATAQSNAEAFAANASNLSSGTVPSARLSGTYSISITGTAANITGILPLSQLAQDAATTGQAIVWNGSAWAPATVASSTVFQVNGTPVSSSATINFESGADITVSNPSAGNISFVTNLSGTYGISITGNATSITGTITYSQVTGVPTFPITFTAVAHEFLTSYNSTTGLFTAAQPAYTDITGTPNLSVYALLAGATFTGAVQVPSLYNTGILYDGTDSAGTNGQVLTSTGTGTLWASTAVTSYATTIGDGSALTYTVTHGLNTEDIIVEVHNISTGEMEVVDVDITGVNTIVLTYGTAPALNSERVVVLSNGGTGNSSGSGGGALVLLEQHAASGSATLDFTTGITSTYDTYLIEVVNLISANDNVCLLAQLSTDGGVTWDSTSSDYIGGSHYTRMDAGGAGDNSGQTSFAGAYLSNSYTNAQPGLSGNIHFYNSSSAAYRQFTYAIQGPGQGGGGYYSQTGGAIWKNTTQATALRIQFDNGNIASGTVRLYGIAKTATGGGSGSGGGGIYPTMTQPISANFTWENQGTSTVVDKTSRMVFSIEETNALDARGMIQTAALPSPPYTVTMSVAVACSLVNSAIAYLVLTDGTTWVCNAALLNATSGNPSGFLTSVRKDVWTSNGTSYVGPSSPLGVALTPSLFWMRFVDDGTSRYFYTSVNGQDWLLFLTEANTTTITATQAGIAFYNNGGGNGIALLGSVYDWSIANSVLPAIGA